jgi:hypothetical protein
MHNNANKNVNVMRRGKGTALWAPSIPVCNGFCEEVRFGLLGRDAA